MTARLRPFAPPDGPDVAGRRSYAGAGFVPVSAAEAAAWNAGQPTQHGWLRLGPG